MSNGMWILITVIGLATLFAAFFWNKRKNDAKAKERLESDPHYRCYKLITETTPVVGEVGSKNYPEAGVILTQDRANLSDKALTHAFTEFQCSYPNAPIGHPAFKHSEYEVCILQSELTPGGNYAFKVPNIGYEGSPWDQGNFIYAAAMMVQIPGETYAVGVADQKERDNVHFNGVWYEAEHWLLAAFDGQKFRDTMVHGQGKGHPIVEGCKQANLVSLTEAIVGDFQALTLRLSKAADIPPVKDYRVCILAVT